MSERMSVTKDQDRVQGGLRSPRVAGVAGIVFAALFTASLLVTRPPVSQSSTSLANWYAGSARSTLMIAGLYLIPLAGIAFLWFIGVLRDRLGDREDRLFATVFLGSGLLFVAMLFVAAATASALALQIDITGSELVRDPGVIQLSQALTYAFMFVYAARTAGVFMIVTSTVTMRTGTVPRWVAILGYAIALVLLLSIRDFQLIILLFPAWVALLSVYLLVIPKGGSVAASLRGPTT